MRMSMRLEGEYRETFAEWFTKARENAGLTKYALAQKAGVSPSVISDIERFVKKPGPHTLERIAHVLNIPLLEMKARAGEITPEMKEAFKESPALWTLVHTIVDFQLTEERIQDLTKTIQEGTM